MSLNVASVFPHNVPSLLMLQFVFFEVCPADKTPTEYDAATPMFPSWDGILNGDVYWREPDYMIYFTIWGGEAIRYIVIY